jgi:hypothetical protein
MANKKTKHKKKASKLKKTSSRKNKAVKKTLRNKPTKKRAPDKKKAPATKKAVATTTAAAKKKPTAKTNDVAPKRPPVEARKLDSETRNSRARSTRAESQSGDLQGLSDVEAANSESVDELLEEGNSFEADVVSGVERAGDNIEEVRTHEVPEDDVPEEYLDKD